VRLAAPTGGGHGMSLSVGEKLKVVEALDRLGIHFIEAGFPSSNPKEAEFFERLAGVETDLTLRLWSVGSVDRRERSAAGGCPGKSAGGRAKPGRP